jgi:tetratricopeptide (TPR) repeat protein
MGQVDESLASTREAASILEQTLGQDDRRTQSEFNNLMLALARANQLDQAEELGRQLLKVREKSRGEGHIETVYSRHNLARVLLQRENYAEALPLETRAVAEITKLLGPENYRTLYMTNNLGMALEATGQLDLAEATLRKTLALRRGILGDLDSNTQRTTAFLARLLIRRDRPEAAKLFRELLQFRRGHRSLDPVLDRNLSRMEDVLSETADPAHSEPILRELVTALESAFWPGDWCTAHVRSLLGGCVVRQGRRSEAAPLLRESLKTMEAAKTTPKGILERARKRLGLLGEAMKGRAKTVRLASALVALEQLTDSLIIAQDCRRLDAGGARRWMRGEDLLSAIERTGSIPAIERNTGGRDEHRWRIVGSVQFGVSVPLLVVRASRTTRANAN